ncbi:MAG: Omp28-related outer membrane protein [Chitinophagales bacterium]|nr:Omp28-related outer membrane protein [Chitinophagales bacterium]
MKRNIKHFMLAAIGIAALGFSACKESPITIPDLKTGNRRVLVEELTGVRCQNCPDGTRELISLQKQYGSENLVVVSIHAAQGSLSQPYTDAPASAIDFRIQEAFELSDYIGVPDGVPTAAVNRIIPSGYTTPYLSRPWSGVIAGEFDKDYGLGLFLINEYKPETRELKIQVNIAPEEALSGEHRLTVLMTQDSIVDVQLDGSTRKAAYIHRHVMRDVVSQVSGDVISEPLSAGALISKFYTLTLPASWDAGHCSVVAFVHHGGNPDKEVLQVAEKHVVE